MNNYGRKVITTQEKEITRENLTSVLVSALSTHNLNQADIKYLYDYYKGKQPILDRVKEVNPSICNRIVENRAYEIVNFKVGYLCGEPIQYVSRKADRSDDVAYLNELLAVESKASRDKKIVEWQEICGTAYSLILPDKEKGDDECPFELYVLDPRTAFVIYSADYTGKALAGVYISQDPLGNILLNVYTQNHYYLVDGLTYEIKDESSVLIGGIPIIEYPGNNARMGGFEPVLSLLDAKNTIESNRVDGIEQFIQSIIIAINCDFPDGTTADTIKQAGLMVLKTIGENKPDFKIMSEELNQTQTQTLTDYIDFMIDKIVGMPSTSNGTTSDSSNNGAVILKNGWQGAEARAKDREIIFKESEQKCLKLMLNILHANGMVRDLKIIDVDYRFTRRCYEDVNSKANVLNLLLSNDKVNPKDAYNVCGLFTDSEVAYQNGMAWYKEVLEKDGEVE